MQSNTKKKQPTTSPSSTNNHLHDLLYAIFDTQAKPEDTDSEMELEIKIDNTGNVTDLELAPTNKT
jgi:helix-turn-helix protein